MIVSLILAAGTSSRYGGANKLLLPFGPQISGGTVVGTALSMVAQTQAEAIVAITGHQADVVSAALRMCQAQLIAAGGGANGLNSLTVVHNPHYREGEMLSSLQTGLRYVMQYLPQAKAILVFLGDQPLLPPDVVNRLIAAYHQGCARLLAPRFRGQRGHPVLIDRQYWPAVLQLTLGQNVRDVLRQHRHDLAFLDVDDEGILLDVDTPEAYQQCLRICAT